MGHSSPVNTLLLDSEDYELYSGLRGGMIVLWDIFNQKVKINLKGHSNQITSMTIYKKNSECVLASGSADGKIKLWDLKSKFAAINIKGHFSQIDSLSFSPNCTYLASGSQDGIIKLWDIRNTYKSLKEINEKDQKSINCIEFNTETKFAFGGKDKIIRYYSIDKFAKIGQTTPDRLPIQKIAFDDNGKKILSATDESMKYWEINEQGLNLIDMFETGWNKLQSFKYIEGKAVCVLGSYGNKISYYLLKYKELIQNPNLILRENPNMENIYEVKDTEDSSFLDSKLGDKIMNGSEININKINEHSNKKLNKKLDESNYRNDDNINYEDNNIGISKFLNNNEINNIDTSITNMNMNKTENESIFKINKELNPGNNNPLLKKDEIKENIKKDNIKENNNNMIDDAADKLMIGDISNMSDISDNKGDITLGMIFGNHTKPEENSNNLKHKDNKEINGSTQNIKDDYEFKEFGEKDVEQFLGNISLNKNLDISEMPSMIKDNELNNVFNDISILSSIKKNNPPTSKFEFQKSKVSTSKDKLTLDDLSSNKGISHRNTNNNIIENKSFVSLKSNETLGIDLNQLIEENGMINDTKNIISQSQDLPILQEINSQHDHMRKQITKRFNGLKIVAEWWKKSDIPSTLNALRILKDYSIVKDFFYYAIISRQDITKIPLTLDSATVMLPYVHILMKSRIDVYWKNACRAGMTFLKIFMEKIEIVMKNKKGVVGTGDKILEENIKKCEETVKIFRQIYESSFLRKHIQEEKNDNQENLAYSFYTDLQFFLKSYDDNNKIIINNI